MTTTHGIPGDLWDTLNGLSEEQLTEVMCELARWGIEERWAEPTVTPLEEHLWAVRSTRALADFKRSELVGGESR